MWVDQRFFSPLELNKMKHLQPEDTPRNATIPRPNRQQRKSTAAPGRLQKALSFSKIDPLAEEIRVVKFVFTATDGQIFSWVRADSSNDPVGPHIDLPGGKVYPNETLLQAAHRELEEQEELSPYGPDLRNKVWRPL